MGSDRSASGVRTNPSLEPVPNGYTAWPFPRQLYDRPLQGELLRRWGRLSSIVSRVTALWAKANTDAGVPDLRQFASENACFALVHFGGNRGQ